MNEEITRVVFRKWFTGAIMAMVALLVLLLLPGVSHALTDDQEALVGLKGVEVVIEKIKPAAERLGLTRDQIKTDVELRLRKAGVRVLTEKERLEMPGVPFLYVNVGIAFNADSTLVAYSIRAELNELVTLDRGFRTRGAIWDTSRVGGVGTGRISELREDVGDQVDRFINDYLAANPK